MSKTDKTCEPEKKNTLAPIDTTMAKMAWIEVEDLKELKQKAERADYLDGYSDGIERVLELIFERKGY